LHDSIGGAMAKSRSDRFSFHGVSHLSALDIFAFFQASHWLHGSARMTISICGTKPAKAMSVLNASSSRLVCANAVNQRHVG